MDGTSEYNGRLELCLNGVWGTVCGDGISDMVAEVVCRQLKSPNAMHGEYI